MSNQRLTLPSCYKGIALLEEEIDNTKDCKNCTKYSRCIVLNNAIFCENFELIKDKNKDTKPCDEFNRCVAKGFTLACTFCLNNYENKIKQGENHD